MNIRIKIFLFCCLLTVKLKAQYQYVDVAPTGNQNYLPYEGGSAYMKIDWTVSLDSLIKRLNGNWELGFTGKGYWIGYTNDMFSIAARNDTAIQPLLNLIDTSKNIHTRIGAVYCLHLIGIDRRIAGRFYEEFVNMKARNALLVSLKYTELQQYVMHLLIRDPRLTDVPSILDVMCNSTSDCWTLVNGLLRYNLNGLPIHQPIPDRVKNLSVGIKYSDNMVLEHDFDFEGQFQEVLDSIRNLNNNFISVEDTLFHSELWGSMRSKLSNGWVRKGVQGVHIGKFLEDRTEVDYLRLGNKINYYVINSKVIICSPMTAKLKLCEWWANLSLTDKKIFDDDKPIYRQTKK